MAKQDMLHPIDLIVALALAVAKGAQFSTYAELARRLGVSSSTAFKAVKRLQSSGLLRPGTREPNLHALRGFLEHGARHAFPPILGREARGVPTAHAGPALRDLFDTERPFVWPEARGSARGMSLTPLYPKATALPEREPEVYNALTLVDALRVGQARERTAALAALDVMLSGYA